VFESVIVILTLVRVRFLVLFLFLHPFIGGYDQDERMEDPFVELAKDCARTCHVLNTVTEESGTDDLSDLSNERIEDLGRCVNLAQSALPTMTGDIRIVHQIESVVRERASCACDSREHRPGPTRECLIAWRMGMLSVFDVCGLQLGVSMVSKLPQGNLGRGGALEDGEINQHVHGYVNVELPPAPDSVLVGFVLPHLRFRPLTACSI